MAINCDAIFDTHTNERLDAQYPAALKHEWQFGDGFQHKETGNAHLSGIESQIDKLGIFVAIAHNQAVVILQLRQCDNQLRFTACFKAVVITAPVVGYFFDNVTLLVDLDREYAAVRILVAALFYGLCKRFVQELDAVIKQVADTQHRRHVQSPRAHAQDNIHNRDSDLMLSEIYVHLCFALL